MPLVFLESLTNAVAKLLFKLGPILGIVKPFPMPTVLRVDHRISRFTQLLDTMATVMDGLTNVPNHERVSVVLSLLFAAAYSFWINKVRLLHGRLQQIKVDPVQLGVIRYGQRFAKGRHGVAQRGEGDDRRDTLQNSANGNP